MTNRELISALSALDPDLLVRLSIAIPVSVLDKTNAMLANGIVMVVEAQPPKVAPAQGHIVASVEIPAHQFKPV